MECSKSSFNREVHSDKYLRLRNTNITALQGTRKITLGPKLAEGRKQKLRAEINELETGTTI